MARTKGPNPIATGAIGAAAGAVLGSAASVLLTNKKTRRTIQSKLQDLGEYAQDAMPTVGDVAREGQLKRAKFAGIKGGRTRKAKKTRS